MRSSRFVPDHEHCYTLFPAEAIAPLPKKRTFRRVDHPIWSHNKARFIAQYLKYFVQITKHGAYIDGFAGPQYPDHLEAWTAAQVLASEPKWLRQFFLCEIDTGSISLLEKLVKAQPIPTNRKGLKLPRTATVHPGDFNLTIEDILKSDRLLQKEATFCLIDQRTFECRWSTLRKIAAYKRAPHNKIELLYFLGVGWIHRAMSGLGDPSTMEPWWGCSAWASLPDMSCIELAELVRARFSQELGYKFTAAYPIFDRDHSNRVMYYMIHASDHGEAPALMVRAHAKAVRALPKEKQSDFWLANES
jgi:three-Cys-motif partner protein